VPTGAFVGFVDDLAIVGVAQSGELRLGQNYSRGQSRAIATEALLYILHVIFVLYNNK